MFHSLRFIKAAAAIGAGAVVAALSLAAGAHAQAVLPAKPLRIIVPFAPGGGADIACRHMQPILSEIIGQQVIVENKAGGGGIIGTEAMVRAAPDGSTIAMVISSHASNPALYKTMPYDALKDTKPITILFRATNVWSVHPSTPYKSLADILAAAKAQPGKIAVVTSGTGTAQHLGFEQLKLATGTDMIHVPYKGAGPALNDLVIGQVQIGILNISSSIQFIRDGRLRPIAVTSAKRSEFAPDVPAVSETLPGFDSVEWFSFVAPAGVPDVVIEALYQAIAKAARTPQYQQRVKDMGVELVLNTPAEFRTYLASEVEKFKDLVQRANIKLE